jgi:hypothetical protein
METIGTRVIDLPFAEGGHIGIEVTDLVPTSLDPAGSPRQTTRSVSEKAVRTFDEALSGLTKIADSLHSVLNAAVTPPDSVSVSFGLKFSADCNLHFVAGKGEATLQVQMTWNKA